MPPTALDNAHLYPSSRRRRAARALASLLALALLGVALEAQAQPDGGFDDLPGDDADLDPAGDADLDPADDADLDPAGGAPPGGPGAQPPTGVPRGAVGGGPGVSDPFNEPLLWLDRSSGIVGEDASAVALAPDNPRQIYVGGRGFIVTSTNEAVTWNPTALLFDGSSVDSDEALVDDDDAFEAFEEADIAERFDSIRDDLLQELIARYGEELAEEMILDIQDGLDAQTLDVLLNDVGLSFDDLDFEEEVEALDARGLDRDQAQQIIANPHTVWRLRTHPAQPGYVWAATSDGLFSSTDRGGRWRRVLDTSYIGPVLSLAIGRQAQVVLAGGAEGLRVSYDAGSLWRSPSGTLSSEPVPVVEVGPRGLYAVTPTGLYSSLDAGVTWRPITLTDFAPADVLDLEAAADERGVLFAGTRAGLYRSDDAGVHWTRIDSGRLVGAASRRVLVIDGDPQRLLVGSDRGVFYTADGGASWLGLNDGLISQDVHELLYEPTSGGLWLVSDLGVFQAVRGDEATIEAETIRMLDAQWALEPSAADVIAAALIYAGLDVLPGDTWKTRVRLGALAPQLTVSLRARALREDEESVTWQLPDSTTPRDNAFIYRQRRQASFREPDVEWRVMALWDVGDLIVPAIDIAIETQLGRMRVSRAELAQTVLQLYMKRRLQQLRIVVESDGSLAQALQHRLDLEEQTALLDAMTGGFFSARLGAAQLDPSDPRDSASAAAPRATP